MNVEFDDMDATTQDVHVGRNWLINMGMGAWKNGIYIQYCMSPSRAALQSLEIPVVSQVIFEQHVLLKRMFSLYNVTSDAIYLYVCF